MLACIFGRTGKSATAASSSKRGGGSDSDDSAADDAENIRWELINPIGTAGGKRAYRAARARLVKESATRIFQVGDCITAKSNTKDVWVGHIVSFFEVSTDKYGKSVSTADSYRVVVRWFYDPNDCDGDDLDMAVNSNAIKDPLNNEIFFSDYVATEGDPLECILGRAIVRGTKQGLASTKTNPPKDFWKDSDKFYLCRAYYSTSHDGRAPKPIRRLEKGELAYLLQNPCKDDLYNKSLLFRRHGHEVKEDRDGNVMYGKHKPIAVKKENEIVYTPNGSKKKEVKKKPKKDNTEIRPMYICKCDPEWNGRALVKAKRKNTSTADANGGEIEAEAGPSKRPRVGNSPIANGMTGNAPDMDTHAGSPSQVVEDMDCEPMNMNKDNGVSTPNGRGEQDVKDEDDLEELPYTPPRLVDNNYNINDDQVAAVEAPVENTAPGYAYAAEMDELDGMGELEGLGEMEELGGIDMEAPLAPIGEMEGDDNNNNSNDTVQDGKSGNNGNNGTPGSSGSVANGLNVAVETLTQEQAEKIKFAIAKYQLENVKKHI